MGFEGFDISHYVNTIEIFAKFLKLWNWNDFLFVANDRFVNLELYAYFRCWNLKLVSLKFVIYSHIGNLVQSSWYLSRVICVALTIFLMIL